MSQMFLLNLPIESILSCHNAFSQSTSSCETIDLVPLSPKHSPQALLTVSPRLCPALLSLAERALHVSNIASRVLAKLYWLDTDVLVYSSAPFEQVWSYPIADEVQIDFQIADGVCQARIDRDCVNALDESKEIIGFAIHDSDREGIA